MPSITSQEILDAHIDLSNKIEDPNTAQLLHIIAEHQKQGEEQLASRASMCAVPMLSSLRDRIAGLEAAELKEITSSQFYNPSTMLATMCILDSILYTSNNGSTYLNNRIRQYIHNLRQIGNPSAEGYAMLADFENANDMFVIKVSRDPTDDKLIHELIVGLYGTNRLRSYVPNFSYVYGGFKCLPPIINQETKEVATWCLNNNNAVNYVVYENIAPSVTLAKYLETCTGREFLIIYMQIIYALILAKLIDFTHYDLHYENILVRTVSHDSTQSSSPNFQIAYNTERGAEYITAQVVATFIDYGFSHITIPETGEHFGRSGFIKYSIYPDKSWIMHDLYKLLMFSLLTVTRVRNTEVISEASKIFRYFNDSEDIQFALGDQRFVFFSLPITTETINFTPEGLAQHIRTVCNCDFISPVMTSDPILDCERMCLTESSVFTEVGVSPIAGITIPDNILEYYDLVIRLEKQGRTSELQQIVSLFTYESSMQAHLRKMNALMRELTYLRRQLKLIDVRSLADDQLLNVSTMAIIRSMYMTLTNIIDKTTDLFFYYDIGRAIAQMYQDEVVIQQLTSIMGNYERHIRPTVVEATTLAKENSIYLKTWTSRFDISANIRINRSLQWYKEGLETFDLILQ